MSLEIYFDQEIGRHAALAGFAAANVLGVALVGSPSMILICSMVFFVLALPMHVCCMMTSEDSRLRMKEMSNLATGSLQVLGLTFSFFGIILLCASVHWIVAGAFVASISMAILLEMVRMGAFKKEEPTPVPIPKPPADE